ncbi:MAG: AAA family ATPase [Acidobacteriota bacterium]
MNNMLGTIINFYLSSSDFNGMPIGELLNQFNGTEEDLIDELRSLLTEHKIVVLGGATENPHILRFPPPEPTVQADLLTSPNPHHTCIYPSPAVLKESISHSLFTNEPYRRLLALGEPQLSFRAFDLIVLEHYRNDPRYDYYNNDISGQIVIADDDLTANRMAESDQVVLETFGFAYDEKLTRAVAVFTRYLARLSPEHQQIWRAKELEGDFKLHNDYYEQSIGGSWFTNVSICDAIIDEIQVINKMSRAMGRKPLFRKYFSDSNQHKPREFCLLIRPTLLEYQSFILLLDKILSDNINKKFFGTDVSSEIEETDKKGRIQVRRKGTLRMLDEWIRMKFNPDDWTLWEDSLETLKKVRKLRQKPAHSLDDNRFDQGLIQEQIELLEHVYFAISTIRLAWQLHPRVQAKKITVPRHLQELRITLR